MNHGILERLQEILLELEVRQFLFLKEAHGKLSKGIKSKEGYVRICVGANLIMICQKPCGLS